MNRKRETLTLMKKNATIYNNIVKNENAIVYIHRKM